jgi:hypothetical protein
VGAAGRIGRMDRMRRQAAGRLAAPRCSIIGWMARLAAATVLVAAAAAGAAQAVAEEAVLVGVDPEDETYRGLSPGDMFACPDGSGAPVPFERLNDGFCDCRDGSDEPGTGVCQGDGGRFFCPNSGFKAVHLFASRVNDGICDCCDGSDEHDSVARCPNTCATMAAEWNEEADAWAAVVTAGIAAKQSYIEEASEAFGTLKKHLRKLDRHIKEQTACAAAHAAVAEEPATALQPDSSDDEIDDSSDKSQEEAVALDASCELDEERLEMLLSKQRELRGHITLFGANFAWYPLAQKCVEFNNTQTGEYIYGRRRGSLRSLTGCGSRPGGPFVSVSDTLTRSFADSLLHSAQPCARLTRSCRPNPTAAMSLSSDISLDGRKEPSQNER